MLLYASFETENLYATDLLYISVRVLFFGDRMKSSEATKVCTKHVCKNYNTKLRAFHWPLEQNNALKSGDNIYIMLIGEMQ